MRKINNAKPRISIGTFNNLVDDFNLRNGTGMGRGGPKTTPQQWGEIKIKNKQGGANRNAGEVLAISNAAIATPDNKFRWFNGGTPSDRISPYAILLEPIPYQKFGRALVSGCCWAWVNVQHVNHCYVDTTTSADALLTYATGSARLLTTPTTTGRQLLPVQLGVPCRGTLLGIADSTITANNTGTVSIYSAPGSDTGYNVTAYAFVAITSTTRMLSVVELNGTYYASPLTCQT